MKRRKRELVRLVSILILMLALQQVLLTYLGKLRQEEKKLVKEEAMLQEKLEMAEVGEYFRNEVFDQILYTSALREGTHTTMHVYWDYQQPDIIEEQANVDQVALKEELKRFLTDEVVKDLAIKQYRRRDQLVPIIAYYYDFNTGVMKNIEAIQELAIGSKMEYFKSIVRNIPIQLTNQHALLTYGKTYEQVIKETDSAYEERNEKLVFLYDQLKQTNPELVDRIFKLESGDRYHERFITYPVLDVSEEDSSKEKVQEIVQKVSVIFQEYESEETVQRLMNCANVEQEFEKKLYTYNLENPQTIIKICKEAKKKEILKVQDPNRYISSSKEIQDLIDENLDKFNL